MKINVVALLALMAMIIGCATGVILTDVFAPSALANNSQSGEFRECFSATLWAIKRENLNRGESPYNTTKIPAGWTPVGGGANQNREYVILCR